MTYNTLTSDDSWLQKLEQKRKNNLNKLHLTDKCLKNLSKKY